VRHACDHLRRLAGPVGFILGLILPALVGTVSKMFGTAFRGALPEPASAAADPRLPSASLTPDCVARLFEQCEHSVDAFNVFPPRLGLVQVVVDDRGQDEQRHRRVFSQNLG
jgi:hypothetical protein